MIHKKKLFSLMAAITLVLTPSLLFGQMFSVDSGSERVRSATPSSAVVFSYDFTNFDFRGPTTGENAPDNRFDFDGPVYRFQFESDFVYLYGGFGSKFGSEQDIRYTQIGIGLLGSLPLYIRPSVQLSIPILLSTDYTLIRNSETANTSDEFGQNSGYIGAGFRAGIRLAESVRITSSTIPGIGYTTGSFGDNGGVSWKLNQQFRFFIDNLVEPFGLTIGYDFRLIRFDNSDDAFNYDLLTNGFLIGITF